MSVTHPPNHSALRSAAGASMMLGAGEQGPALRQLTPGSGSRDKRRTTDKYIMHQALMGAVGEEAGKRRE